MAFSYQFGANPPIDYPRLLISDTQDTGHVFEDSEILAFAAIASNVWQSSMKYSGVQGIATLPTPPTNYLRTAALALDALASNRARLSGITELLDVKLSVKDAALQLRAQAQTYRDVDDDSMAFVIIEQCNDQWSFQQRFWSQVQRTMAV